MRPLRRALTQLAVDCIYTLSRREQQVCHWKKIFPSLLSSLQPPCSSPTPLGGVPSSASPFISTSPTTWTSSPSSSGPQNVPFTTSNSSPSVPLPFHDHSWFLNFLFLSLFRHSACISSPLAVESLLLRPASLHGHSCQGSGLRSM